MMRCEEIEVAAKPQTRELICVGCGCTDSHACPGGCYWVSHRPPLCSACASSAGDMLDAGELEPGLYVRDEDGGADDANRSGLYGAERCPASATPALHAKIWVDDVSGYCARCRQGFVA